jgi:hypothetical protein
MRELTERELYLALQFAKNNDEEDGKKIIEQFQANQPALAQTIFGVFPSVIAEQDQDVAHLFMDLCFDVICVFQHTFGLLPDQNDMGFDWLEKSAVLIDTELQALMPHNDMDQKIRDKLQDRFSKRMMETDAQTGLVIFMNESINQFAAENKVSANAIKICQTMIFVVIQLFCSMYDHANT